MGNAHGEAYWTANVQAGMCTRVARGVSFALFPPNCGIRQAGQRRVHGACSSVRLCVGLRGHGNSLDGTDSGRARVGRSTARPSSAFDCMGMEILWDGTDGVAHAWDGRLFVVRARSTATASSSVRAYDCDCLSALCVRLRLHVCALRSTATARLRSAFGCYCTSCGHEKHGHEKGALRLLNSDFLSASASPALYVNCRSSALSSMQLYLSLSVWYLR